jgi:HlyD family secretion protein
MNLLKVHRIWQHAQRFLGSQQTYDEIFAKYQGAQAQYIAVQAELDEAKKGADRATMARGQKERAGALQEAETEPGALYRCSQDMSIETITLNLGELALAGYTLFT